jgi:hypothetical protein
VAVKPYDAVLADVRALATAGVRIWADYAKARPDLGLTVRRPSAARSWPGAPSGCVPCGQLLVRPKRPRPGRAARNSRTLELERSACRAVRMCT